MLKVREGGRVVPVHALLATGVNSDGHGERLGLDVTTSKGSAGWRSSAASPAQRVVRLFLTKWVDDLARHEIQPDP